MKRMNWKGQTVPFVTTEVEHLSDRAGFAAPPPPVGTLIPMPELIASSEDDKPWRSHRPSQHRRPPNKSPFNYRGSTLDADGDELGFESGLEGDVMDILQADRRVRKIRSQAATVHYVLDGEKHRTTIDLLVDLNDRRRIAMAVKPEELRVPSGIDRIMEAVYQQRAIEIDGYKVVSEKSVTRSKVHRARTILRARKLRVEQDVELLRTHVAQLRGVTRLGQICEQYQHPARAFNAVVNLLDEGAVVAVRSGPLTYRTEIATSVN